MELWEILVPTKMGDNDKPVRKRHHRNWDVFVRKITNGLTIFHPVKGQWQPDSQELFEERMIPVRIACTEKEIKKIIDFTLIHYRQLAVMAYKISDYVLLVENPDYEAMARRRKNSIKKTEDLDKSV